VHGGIPDLEDRFRGCVNHDGGTGPRRHRGRE
jgi:hypothetical protein